MEVSSEVHIAGWGFPISGRSRVYRAQDRHPQSMVQVYWDADSLSLVVVLSIAEPAQALQPYLSRGDLLRHQIE